MTTQKCCCGTEIVVSGPGPKYRVDLTEPQHKQGFDVCEACYTKVKYAAGVADEDKTVETLRREVASLKNLIASAREHYERQVAALETEVARFKKGTLYRLFGA